MFLEGAERSENQFILIVNPMLVKYERGEKGCIPVFVFRIWFWIFFFWLSFQVKIDGIELLSAFP